MNTIKIMHVLFSFVMLLVGAVAVMLRYLDIGIYCNTLVIALNLLAHTRKEMIDD